METLGKSTVAPIFKDILSVMGVRQGHLFILKMTASEAIRKGSKAFAQDVANLTGQLSSACPHLDLVLEGSNVQVTVKDKLYPAIVKEISKGGKGKLYKVEYADGRVENDVTEERIEANKVGGIGGSSLLTKPTI
jgi:hypothetical protein